MKILFFPIIATLFLTLCITNAHAKGDESFVVESGPTSILGNTSTGSSAPASPLASSPAIVPTATEDETGIEYNIVSSKPPRVNSTGVSHQTIANANHAYVYTSPIKTYLAFTDPPEGECKAPIPTGMTVYRQTVENGRGKIIQVNDAFCLNQGCVYFGDEDAQECR